MTGVQTCALPIYPQTSGGLLISVPADKANSLLEDLNKNGVKDAAIIGEVTGEGTKVIVE